MGSRHLVCVVYEGASGPSSDPTKWPVAQYGERDAAPDITGLHVVRFLADPANINHLKAGLLHLYTPTDDERTIIDEDLAAANAADDARTAAMGGPWNMLQGMINQAGNGDDGRASRRLYPSLCPSTGAGILDLVAQLGKNHQAGTPDKDVELPAKQRSVAADSPSTDLQGRLLTSLFTALQGVVAQTTAVPTTTSASNPDTTPPTVASAIRKGKLPVQREPEFAVNTIFCRYVYVVDLETETLEVYGDWRTDYNYEAKHPGHRFRDVGAPGDAVPNLIATVEFAKVRSWAAQGAEEREFRKLVGADRFKSEMKSVMMLGSTLR